ncbi:hypothetical protein K2P96_01815 [Patescibacteria group bacterium]|nr:hypothetical protein [Patescibacteria group bacterium]
MGIHLAKTFGDLSQAIEDGVNQGNSILVEEFIYGKPSAVHSLANFRNEDVYVLPPQNFTSTEKEQIISTAKNLFNHVGATHYLKADFIFHPTRGLVLTDIYFLPDIQTGSHFHQACEYVGANMDQIIEHLLKNSN